MLLELLGVLGALHPAPLLLCLLRAFVPVGALHLRCLRLFLLGVLADLAHALPSGLRFSPSTACRNFVLLGTSVCGS